MTLYGFSVLGGQAFTLNKGLEWMQRGQNCGFMPFIFYLCLYILPLIASFTLPSALGGWHVWSTSCAFCILAEAYRRLERKESKIRLFLSSLWSGCVSQLMTMPILTVAWRYNSFPVDANSYSFPCPFKPRGSNAWLLLNLGCYTIPVVPWHLHLFHK